MGRFQVLLRLLYMLPLEHVCEGRGLIIWWYCGVPILERLADQ